MRGLALLLISCLLAGCSVDSAQLVPLPGGPGSGGDARRVVVRFADVANLVPRSEVKVDDVTVGAVRRIGLHGWQAEVEIGLDPGVVLPANAVAAVGQKSLLGAQYVELAAPPDPVGRLADGAVIPAERTNRYPGTEELLAALSLWLNGGGLRQVRVITDELNRALGGNEQQTRDLIHQLGALARSADEQKAQIVRSIEAVDGLAARLRANSQRLGRAVDELGPGIRVLNEQRDSLRSALDASSRLGAVGTDVLDRSRDDLLAVVDDLRPSLQQLVAAGDDVPKSLDTLGTLLFPLSTYRKVIRGDFLNLAVTLDLSVPSLESGLLAGTPAEPVLDAARTALQATDPIRGPLGVGSPIEPPPPSPPPENPPPDPAIPLLGDLLGGN
ncbi:MCE family protein [Saccharopolyspora sp. ID03-671]|uniref:MCE family protein n=1 Tax=Saccharopolyspora sp. ID03-671 TaxID=3073066 RepID=UPI00324B54B9